MYKSSTVVVTNTYGSCFNDLDFLTGFLTGSIYIL